MYEKYPGNSEVAAFYALSLLWADGPDGDTKNEILSAKIADGILRENPNHPGAVHYKIHALDNPALAIDAQIVADLYAKIAPDATHALHMPSHIYLALGRWADVVACNEASYGASIKRLERKNLGPAERGYHSYAWLHYGYLQQGRYEDAARLLADMYTFKEESPNAGARGYLIGMQNAQMIEAPEWTLQMHPQLDIKSEDLSIATQASQAFLAGSMSLAEHDEEGISAQIKNLEAKIKIAAMLVSEDGTAMCSAGTTRYAPNRNTILMAETQLHQLQALQAAAHKSDSKYEEFIRLATAKELSTEYGSGPPTVALPSSEQYGYWLLDKGRFAEALDQFNQSLKRSPKRVNALRGSWTALKALGKTNEAQEVYAELQAIWVKADKAALNTIASI
jgi:tetratricopeptide (TPR) repeat protein